MSGIKKLRQRYTAVFPLIDQRMTDINLGQLLSFSAGIRGNNPVYVNGVPSEIDPIGPDGWYALVDEYALGQEEGMANGKPFSTKTLWCDPGEGFSYATASIHNASIMLRFCYLLLHKGNWNGRQLVPEEYIRAATTSSPYNPHFPYSLQFNVNSNGEISELPNDAFWKSGSGGHCLYVVPSLDLIVWKLGGRDGQYSIRDTGLPEHEPLPNAEQPIKGWPEFQENAYIKTLEMVIQSIY